jgi:SAM-dependent methyltransferase
VHKEVQDFIRLVRLIFPSYFTKKRVLEVGSLDVNGSPRPFFTDCDYLGIDCRPGPGVDVVGKTHECRLTACHYDVVVSTECFEHDPHLADTLTVISRALKPGGLFLATCAGPDRPEHGTRRTEDAGGTWGPDADFYRNVTAEYIHQHCRLDYQPLELHYGRGKQDLYFLGFRR